MLRGAHSSPLSHGTDSLNGMNQTIGNTTLRHQNVALLGIAEAVAPVEVTSAELDAELADVLTRLGLPHGLLERVAGVHTRRQWETQDGFIAGSAQAGRDALEQAGIRADQIGLMINGSVSRVTMEPSVAVSIHNELGLGTHAMNFDVTNACLGFVNGMTMAAAMIDSGQIEYAMVVAGESTNALRENTVKHLHREGITRAEYLEEFASLTLGSGAAAAVLGPADRHPEGHRVKGGAAGLRGARDEAVLRVPLTAGVHTGDPLQQTVRQTQPLQDVVQLCVELGGGDLDGGHGLLDAQECDVLMAEGRVADHLVHAVRGVRSV